MIFDKNELLERLGGRTEMLPRFVSLFCKGVSLHMDELVAAVAANDADSIRRHAHAIKGSAGNIAARRMHHTAEAMEKGAREGDLTEAAHLLAALQQEYLEFTETVSDLGIT